MGAVPFPRTAMPTGGQTAEDKASGRRRNTRKYSEKQLVASFGMKNAIFFGY